MVIYIYRITSSVSLVKQNHHQIDFMLQFYACCYSIYSKLKCNVIKMRLRDKCFPINLLHIFGTPIRKFTTGGLLVGGMVSMSTFLT